MFKAINCDTKHSIQFAQKDCYNFVEFSQKRKITKKLLEGDVWSSFIIQLNH